MTYSLDERATGNSINESNDVARKGEQKLRQPKLNQTALRAALATAQQEAGEARAALATAQQEAAEARAALATAQQEAAEARTALATAQQEEAEAQRRLDELRGTLIDLRQERDAWRAQAQRLAEKLRGKRPAWWQWGTAG
jgi:chromosome segregation ATPase